MVRNSLKMSRRCFSSMGRLLYVFADIHGPITMQSVHSCWTVRHYSYSSYKLLRNQILKQVTSKEKSLTSIHDTHISVCFMYVLLFWRLMKRKRVLLDFKWVLVFPPLCVQFCYASGLSGRHDWSSRDFCTLSYICAVFVEDGKIVGKNDQKKKLSSEKIFPCSLHVTCFKNCSSTWDQCYSFFRTWFYWTRTSCVVFTYVLTLCHKV